MKSIPDCSFAYWEVACSADCQTSKAQPVGSTLAISALCSSSSNGFVQMMALTGSSGVAIHPSAPGYDRVIIEVDKMARLIQLLLKRVDQINCIFNIAMMEMPFIWPTLFKNSCKCTETN